MNIWALDKDLSIKHLLLLLSECLGAESFCISSNPELDAMAIRIYKPDEKEMCAYLFTYGQDPERYGVHLEYPSPPDIAASKTIDMQEDLDLEQLVAVLQVHML